MNKRGWLIPVFIVAVNALAIIVKWSSLQELLPAHFNLQGNAGGSMPRSMLLLYPLAGAVICLLAYLICRFLPKFQKGMVIMVSGITLVILSSTMVTLTMGKMPVFMLAEPVILLAAIVASVIWYMKSRKLQS